MPTLTPDPLLSLVGLSRAGGLCFPLPPVSLPTDNDYITASDSGYYVDALPGLELGTIGGNPASDAYQRMAKARAFALVSLRAALRIGGIGQPLYQERGTLGGTGNGAVGTPGPLVLYTTYREAGALRITSIRLNTTAGVLDVPVLLDGTEVARLTATNAGPQPISLTIPLDGQRHELLAMLPEGVRPLENKLHCSPCSGQSAWGKAVARNLQNVTATTSAQGFQLVLAEACAADVADLLLFAVSGEDLGAQERRQQLAQALVYLSASAFVRGLVVGAQANRYTVLEPKMLPALGEYFDAEAAKSIKWLNGTEGLGRVQHPCYACVAPYWHPAITNQLRS